MGEKELLPDIQSEDLKRREHLRDLGIKGRVISHSDVPHEEVRFSFKQSMTGFNSWILQTR
jgi:hypothetical protein